MSPSQKKSPHLEGIFLLFDFGPIGEALDLHGTRWSHRHGFPCHRIVRILIASTIPGELVILTHSITENLNDNAANPSAVVLIPISYLGGAWLRVLFIPGPDLTIDNLRLSFSLLFDDFHDRNRGVIITE